MADVDVAATRRPTRRRSCAACAAGCAACNDGHTWSKPAGPRRNCHGRTWMNYST